MNCEPSFEKMGVQWQLGVGCDNSPRPKAAIHYWRNRIGMVGWFGVEYAPTEQHVICFVQLTDF